MIMPDASGTTGVVGTPINRVDGTLKITGAARYTAEIPVEGLLYGVMVTSTIARGEIEEIDTSAADMVPGVIRVMTPENTPKLESLAKYEREGGKGTGGSGGGRPTGRALSLFQDRRVEYNGQPIALVIADSVEAATHAVSLVRVTYRAETPAVDMVSALASAYPYTQ
jgi:xanthine dehydrogenase YagR molybdenum-binding subunit